jgi:DNA mismatch repair protein MutS
MTTQRSGDGASPAMAQWFAVKDTHPDALLFFRMGDFYELFFEDAKAAASALSISLTARGTHAGEPIAMCGVPVVSSDAYLARLIRRGYRVAIVEQMEKGPSEGGPKRSGKTPLHREVVRLVTAGTLTEEALLEGARSSLLLAIAVEPGSDGMLGAAAADLAAGTIETERVTRQGLAELLARVDPAEILAPEGVALGPYAALLAPGRLAPPPLAARARAAEAFGAASLEAFGTFSDVEAMALASVLDYARAAGAGKLPRLAAPVARPERGFLGIDGATRASLEIVREQGGGGRHTLLAAVARTITAQGERLLAARLASPIDDLGALRERQAEWVVLGTEPDGAAGLRAALRGAPDALRALGRLSLGRGGPRDLGAVRDALAAGVAAGRALEGLPAPLGGQAGLLLSGEALHGRLTAMLQPGLPARIEEGGVVADGVDAALDESRALARDSRAAVAALQAALAARYGVAGLKIRHHAQLGFVIEVAQAAVEGLRARPELSLRQGMASGARFASAELAELDERISGATEAAVARERALVAGLVDEVLGFAALPAIAERIAALDVAQGAASLAAGGSWCVPTLCEDASLVLTGCRHPVVEAALPARERFTANDLDLSPGRRLMLLTGPNMAGKSTFLRQAALAVVLAQSGLPVPAASARIGLVDRLFSRVGASDDLARGRSTFMVEMIEAAAILHAAGPRSLVVVDEIGRGTSTLDGLAIATAVLEALHGQVRCRTIFATHFHELAEAAERLPQLCLHTMRVREWQGEVVFQHEVVPGAAGRSWGVQVAKLAGVPGPVVVRAGVVLAALERRGRAAGREGGSLPLFAGLTEDPAPAAADPVHEALLAVDPDALTPRQAQEALYRLRSLLVAAQDNVSASAERS